MSQCLRACLAPFQDVRGEILRVPSKALEPDGRHRMNSLLRPQLVCKAKAVQVQLATRVQQTTGTLSNNSGGPQESPMLWSHIPSVVIVSDASNIAQMITGQRISI